MTGFIPDPAVVGAFIVAAAVLALTPGPDMTLFLGKAITGGRLAGLAAFFGAVAGILVHSLFAAVGLSALLAASPQAFLVLKVAGALYLVWLAVQAVRKGSGLTLDGPREVSERLSVVFAAGLGINLLNPKIILFFVTFLPQFVAVTDPHAVGKLLFLCGVFIAIAIAICVPMILAADRIATRLKQSPWMIRSVDWLFATVMGGFAVRLLLAEAD